MNRDEIDRKINGVRWFHKFEVLPGIMTPGPCPVNAKKRFDSFKLPADLSGARALDIGTWDGAYAFELERRGAQVMALDLKAPSSTGFNTAKEIRESNVEYVQASVYDAAKVLNARFDVVLFFGVYYHLRHPLLAFEQIQQLLKDDGVLLIEGECLRNFAPTPEEAEAEENQVSKRIRHLEEGARPARDRRRFDPLAWIRRCHRVIARRRPSRFARTMAESPVPIALCYSGRYKQDGSNWFVPNLACIREWLAAVDMELSAYELHDRRVPIQRLRGSARKIAQSTSAR